MDSDSDSDREKSSDPNEELLSSDNKTFHDDVDDDSSVADDDDDDGDGDDDDEVDDNSSCDMPADPIRQQIDAAQVQATAEQQLVVLMQTEAIEIQQQQQQQQQQIDVRTDVLTVVEEQQLEVATSAAQREPLLAKYGESVRESVECFYSAQDLLEYGHMLSSSSAQEQRTPDVESGYFDKSESDDVSRDEFEAISSSLRRPKDSQFDALASAAPLESSSESLRMELSRFCSSMEAFERQQLVPEASPTPLLLGEQLEHRRESGQEEGTAVEQFDTQSEPYIMQVYRLGNCLGMLAKPSNRNRDREWHRSKEIELAIDGILNEK